MTGYINIEEQACTEVHSPSLNNDAGLKNKKQHRVVIASCQKGGAPPLETE